jgi:hypothetical protein
MASWAYDRVAKAPAGTRLGVGFGVAVVTLAHFGGGLFGSLVRERARLVSAPGGARPAWSMSVWAHRHTADVGTRTCSDVMRASRSWRCAFRARSYIHRHVCRRPLHIVDPCGWTATVTVVRHEFHTAVCKTLRHECSGASGWNLVFGMRGSEPITI